MASRKSSAKTTTSRKSTRSAARPKKATGKAAKAAKKKTARSTKKTAKSAKKATRGTTKPARKVARKSARAPRAKVRRKKPESLRVRAILPGITVDDVKRSLEFYVGALGCVVQEEWRHEGALVGAMLKTGRTGIGLGQDDWKLGKRRKKGQGMRLYLETAQDIDALAERIRGAGYELTEEPHDQPWGAYALSVDDPDGFHLTIFRPTKKLY